MNLWIGHYHLHPGGVTRIIQSQVSSLRSGGMFQSVSVLSGTQAEIPIDGTVVWDPMLDYMDPDQDDKTYRDAVHRIWSLLTLHIQPHDILHFHNPNLGKNPPLTYVLSRLAAEGYRLFLHCHDFAEDRPENMAFLEKVIGGALGQDVPMTMYPEQSGCQFGVLNSADRRRMVAGGVDTARVTLLPNPVALPQDLPRVETGDARDEICRAFDIPANRMIFLYPIRVIPRKNIGELILLMSLFTDRAFGLVTLAPNNPAWMPDYKEWVEFSREIDAPVKFEASDRVEFERLMQGADRMITTSIKEGFGMMYLEPWLVNRPVVGRNLPDVVQDFMDAGMGFDALYDRLPVDWNGEITDFGELDAEAQREVIRRTLGDAEAADRLRHLLEARLFGSIGRTTIEANRELIEREYSLERYRDRLSEVYTGLGATSQTT